MLPPSVQVCPIEIPGRGRREGEPSINEISELANILAHALPLQVPFLSLHMPNDHDFVTCAPSASLKHCLERGFDHSY